MNALCHRNWRWQQTGYYKTTKISPGFFVVTVHLKLGEVADPYAPVWIQLVGEMGESGQIQIKPGYGPQDKFEKGRIYKVVARVADIGRVRSGCRGMS